MEAYAHSFPLEREHCRCYSASYDTDTALIRTRRPAKAFAAVTLTDLGRQVLSYSPWNAEFQLPGLIIRRHHGICGIYTPAERKCCMCRLPCRLVFLLRLP